MKSQAAISWVAMPRALISVSSVEASQDASRRFSFGSSRYLWITRWIFSFECNISFAQGRGIPNRNSQIRSSKNRKSSTIVGPTFNIASPKKEIVVLSTIVLRTSSRRDAVFDFTFSPLSADEKTAFGERLSHSILLLIVLKNTDWNSSNRGPGTSCAFRKTPPWSAMFFNRGFGSSFFDSTKDNDGFSCRICTALFDIPKRIIISIMTLL